MSPTIPRHALVTGSSRGIGAQIARQLAERGCVVAVHGSSATSSVEVVRRSLAGSGHISLVGDLASAAECQSLVAQALMEWSRIDILIHNAGIYIPHSVDECTFEVWRDVWRDTTSVNLFSAADLSKLVIDSWLDDANGPPSGRIVAIGSRGSSMGEPGAPAYGATKAGLVALVQSLALAIGPMGGIAAAVSPGVVDTEMTQDLLAGPFGDQVRSQSPLGRVATADEIASIAVWLALDAPPIISGAVIDANGASYLR